MEIWCGENEGFGFVIVFLVSRFEVGMIFEFLNVILLINVEKIVIIIIIYIFF